MNSHPPRRYRSLTVAAAACALAAVLALSACGGSSSSSKKQSSTASSTAPATQGSFGARRAAIAACLGKQGIKLPPRPPGPPGAPGAGSGPGRPGGPGRGLFGGGGPGGGPGGTRAGRSPKIRAALQKCGLSFGRGRFARNSPAFRQAVTNYVECVRKHGFKLPAPNFSGHGAVFKASQVNRNDPKFVAASSQCRGLLRFGPPGGAAG